MTTEKNWTWRVVDSDGNVTAFSDEPIELEMTAQLGETIPELDPEEE